MLFVTSINWRRFQQRLTRNESGEREINAGFIINQDSWTQLAKSQWKLYVNPVYRTLHWRRKRPFQKWRALVWEPVKSTSFTGIQTIQGREAGSNQGDLTFINPSKNHRRLAAIIGCRNELKWRWEADKTPNRGQKKSENEREGMDKSTLMEKREKSALGLFTVKWTQTMAYVGR